MSPLWEDYSSYVGFEDHKRTFGARPVPSAAGVNLIPVCGVSSYGATLSLLYSGPFPWRALDSSCVLFLDVDALCSRFKVRLPPPVPFGSRSSGSPEFEASGNLSVYGDIVGL